jgi:hypothetical protein
MESYESNAGVGIFLTNIIILLASNYSHGDFLLGFWLILGWVLVMPGNNLKQVKLSVNEHLLIGYKVHIKFAR